MSRAKAEKIKKKLREKAEKKKQNADEKKKAKEEEKKSGKKKDPRDILSIIQLVSSLAVAVIGRFSRHLRINIARIKLVIASEDAANTAILYGAVCQSLNVFLPILEDVKNFPKLKKADISVDCDFGATVPKIDIKLGFSIRVWQVFNIAFGALGALIKHLLRSGAKKSSSDNN